MATLRTSLALDSGDLSRLLARFDAAGLIARTPSPVDGRRQALALTAAGKRLFRTLDERSNRQWRPCWNRSRIARKRHLRARCAP